MSGIRKPPVGAQLNLDHPLSHGLVACYLLNESDGKNVHDYSGQNNEGTISGMNDPPIATSGWNAGPHGGALAFDGVDDYVDCENGASLDMNISSFTLAYLANPDLSLLRYGGVCARHTKPYSPYVRFEQPATIRARIQDEDANEIDLRYNNAIGGKWWQPVLVRDKGNTLSLYVNGVERDSEIDTLGDLGNIHSNGWTIGKIEGWYFLGLISSVSIYNRALSAEEIAYLYAFPYCMFDDGTDWRSRLVPYIPVRDSNKIIAEGTVRSVNSGRERGATAATRVRGV